MSLECVICLKRVSEERDFSLDSGYVGKSVPFTPSLVGWAVINAQFLRDLRACKSPIQSSFLKKEGD